MGRRSSKAARIPFYPLMVLLLIGSGGYLGCDADTLNEIGSATSLGGLDNAASTASQTPQYSASIPQRIASKILIGSFNMQRLGPSKLKDAWVMQKFAEIIRCFDVIAIQEITSKDQSTLPQLMAVINANQFQYAYTISPRIGRSELGYYEQYAFIYDTSRIQSGPEYCYVVQDEADVLHREPFVGRFATRSQRPFQFTLINIHTDPDEIAYELDVLADVYRNVRRFEYPEDDVILLGDLNQQPGSLQQLERIPSMAALIQGLPTNTRKSKTLDNILIDSQSTIEFAGRSGTLDMERVFSIDYETAAKISDHLPIWAEFSITERAAPGVASVGAPVLR